MQTNKTMSANDMPETQVQRKEIEDLHRRARFELANPDQADQRVMWQQAIALTRGMLLDLGVIEEANYRLLNEPLEPAQREAIKRNLSHARQSLVRGTAQLNRLKGDIEPCEQLIH